MRVSFACGGVSHDCFLPSCACSCQCGSCAQSSARPCSSDRLHELLADSSQLLTAARLWISRTCGCDTTVRGHFLRAGCSGLCDDLALAEATTFSWKFFDVGNVSCNSFAVVTWRDTFIADYEAYLMDMGWLTETHLWTAAYYDKFADLSFRDLMLHTSSFDLAQWVDPDQLCDVIWLLDGLFGTSLCETNFSSSLGTLQSLCPQQCGLCDDIAGVSISHILSFEHLLQEQSDLLAAGSISHTLFEWNSSNYYLTCDSYSTHSTIGGWTPSVGWSPSATESPGKFFVFRSERNQTVVFSTCHGSEFNTIISVYTSWWSWLIANDHHRLCEDGTSSRVHLDAQAGWEYHIHVNGRGKSQQGTFGLSTECCVEDDDECSHKGNSYYWRTWLTPYSLWDYYWHNTVDFDYLDSLFN